MDDVDVLPSGQFLSYFLLNRLGASDNAKDDVG